MEFSRRNLLKAGAALAITPALINDPQSLARAADPYADGVLVAGEPPALEQGAFTIVVLPDTQNYSEKFPETYVAQTKWIVDNKAARNIASVLHLGDITNNNRPNEWENAVKAMHQLDGHVPYFMVPGNHDYSQNGGCKDRTTLLNEYFPISNLKDRPTFGGVYDKEPDRVENSYHLFEAEGRKFLVLGLEFGPRKDVLRWANEVVGKYQDRSVILITHAFIYFNETRYDWKKYGAKQNWNPHAYGVAKATQDDVSDGEEIWEQLVSKHENFILTLNGHVLGDGLGRVTTATPGGRAINQLLVNFQMRPKGGDGWLRLLEFRPDGKTVQVYDYSPTRGERNESKQNQFTMTVPAAPGTV
jgi:predicted phosphodiesterase